MSCLRRRVRALLLSLVLFGLLPGAAELLAVVEHLVHDGHLPRSAAHLEAFAEGAEHHDAAERGCSPLSHRCSCHPSQALAPPPEPVTPIARAGAGRRLLASSAQAPRPPGVAPPLRPPIG